MGDIISAVLGRVGHPLLLLLLGTIIWPFGGNEYRLISYILWAWGGFELLRQLLNRRAVLIDYNHVFGEMMETWNNDQHFYWENEHVFSIKNVSGTPIIFSDFDLSKSVEGGWACVRVKGGPVLYAHKYAEHLADIAPPWSPDDHEEYAIPTEHYIVKPEAVVEVAIEYQQGKAKDFGTISFKRWYPSDGIWDVFRTKLEPRIKIKLNLVRG